MEVKEKGDMLIIDDDGWRLILLHVPEKGHLLVGQGDATQNIMSGAFIAGFDDVADWIAKRRRLLERGAL